MLRHNLHISYLILSNRAKRLDSSAFEFASRDMRIEEHVHLCIRAALWLGDAEIRPNCTQSTDTSPEETSLRAPIPSARVEHVRSEDICDDACDVVEVSGEHDGLVAEAC